MKTELARLFYFSVALLGITEGYTAFQHMSFSHMIEARADEPSVSSQPGAPADADALIGEAVDDLSSVLAHANIGTMTKIMQCGNCALTLLNSQKADERHKGRVCLVEVSFLNATMMQSKESQDNEFLEMGLHMPLMQIKTLVPDAQERSWVLRKAPVAVAVRLQDRLPKHVPQADFSMKP